jgi:sialate O-acetylesterase
MMTSFRQAALGAATFFLASPVSLQADVKLPAIFGDHMVLQEGKTLPVWGTAAAGEAVTVKVGSETAQAMAGANGKWQANLAPLQEGSAPVTLTVTGKNTVTFNDVLVGDVWICSGQSNMEFDLGGVHSFGGAANAATAVPAANDPQLRLFVVAKKTSIEPLSDVTGKWQVCTPASAGLFSAVGYFFGHELRTVLNRPIGLIGTYWGGTPAQAWTSLSGLEKDPVLQHYADTYEKNVADLPKRTTDYPAQMTAYKATLAAWSANGGADYNEKLKSWTAAAKQAEAAGQMPPPKPVPATPMPRPPPTPDGGQNAPTTLFNGMLDPLIPFAIKGAIWYQGEANAGAPLEYRTLFPAMITDWRQKWNEGDFPFLFVQLAANQAGPVQNWPFLREAQLKTLSLPNTGMATAIDIGNPADIHPKDKLDVGQRLALAARHVAYGEKLVYSGPMYEAMKIEGSAIRVTFTKEGGDLIIGSAPWVAPGYPHLPTTSLLGFTVAGADNKFVPADAKIDGDSVVVSSPQVPNPVAVRYDWANAPQGNLYNKKNLPASSFRSDDLPFDPKTAVLIPAK